MNNSEQYSLMIDPQFQAKNFLLKNLSKLYEKRLIVSKPGKELSKYLINSVRLGQILVLENIGEQLDSLLDPVLAKAFDQPLTAGI